MKTVLLWMAFSSLAMAATIEADSRRGATLFEQQKCTVCHATNGQGGKLAPDLGRRLDRNYSPAGIASLMWNHAPRMWAAQREAKIPIPQLSESDSADLFAFFYAKRFFEKGGDASRGKQAFAGKCAECHAAAGPGKPAVEWTSLTDSVELVQRLWNHAPEMRQALEAKKRHWPEISSAELTDLLVYVQNMPGTKPATLTFSLPSGTGGKALLESKGCTGCHKGSSALEGRLGHSTLTDIAAAIWNHTPAMREKAQTLSVDEMREILAYVWGTDFFRSQGSAAGGKKVFDSKCGSCHNTHGQSAPELKAAGKSYSAITMVWALWNHGPKMLEQAEKLRRGWPELTEADMENLTAFLNQK